MALLLSTCGRAMVLVVRVAASAAATYSQQSNIERMLRNSLLSSPRLAAIRRAADTDTQTPSATGLSIQFGATLISWYSATE
jgi:hypothetical protein